MAPDADRLWVASMPDAYEQWLVPSVFRPFAVDLARRVSGRAPGRVLELAAGTGAVTRELLRVLGAAEVTAIDLNPAMVDAGRARAPGATWRQADALALPFDDAEFDAVVCQFGVMFFPDKPAAFAEARRVLRPGGRVFLNVWDTVDTHGYATALMAGVRRAFPDDPPLFIVSIPHGYTERGRIVADLAAGGLACAAFDTVTLVGEAASAADVAAGFCRGTPLRAGIEARGDLERATAVVTEEMEAVLGAGPVRAEMTAHVIEAVPATG